MPVGKESALVRGSTQKPSELGELWKSQGGPPLVHAGRRKAATNGEKTLAAARQTRPTYGNDRIPRFSLATPLLDPRSDGGVTIIG